jgi:hypothetical protein
LPFFPVKQSISVGTTKVTAPTRPAAAPPARGLPLLDRPRESPLLRLVEQLLEELLRARPARFVRQHGPLRPVVERVLREFLECGLLEHGYVLTQSVLSLHHAHATA